MAFAYLRIPLHFGDRVRAGRTAVMRSFLVALAFLSVVPIRFRTVLSESDLARSRFWYPVVGLMLGAILGAAAALAAYVTAPPVGAFLVLVLWVILTGALHLDGFCDLCDGLFGGRSIDERLVILKDPHLGSFGLAGGVMLLLGKFVMLSEVLTQPERGPWLVAGAAASARCLVLGMAAGARYPRTEGTGKILIEATRPREAALSLSLTLAIAFGATSGAFRLAFLALALVPALAVAALRTVCAWRLDGVTGDCLGAAIELAELTFLLSAVLLTSG
jgi:adenosylcobinamide-GDP ribazoletransferase